MRDIEIFLFCWGHYNHDYGIHDNETWALFSHFYKMNATYLKGWNRFTLSLFKLTIIIWTVDTSWLFHCRPRCLAMGEPSGHAHFRPLTHTVIFSWLRVQARPSHLTRNTICKCPSDCKSIIDYKMKSLFSFPWTTIPITISVVYKLFFL